MIICFGLLSLTIHLLVPPCLTGSSQISGDWVSVGSWPVSLGSSWRQRAQEQEEKPEATFRGDGERWWWKVTKARFFRRNKGRLVSLIKLTTLIRICFKIWKKWWNETTKQNEILWLEVYEKILKVHFQIGSWVSVHSFSFFHNIQAHCPPLFKNNTHHSWHLANKW